jgi:arylsulfatase A-like enzyme
MEPHLNYAATAPHLGRFSEANPAAEAIKLDELVGKSHRHTPPAKDVQEYVRQRYDEEIRVADDGIRHLVDQLKARGRWENTALIITSDHGEEFWDHGGFEHGHTLMGELTRVPLIAAGGAVPKHGRVDAVVEHVDLVAGLLALAQTPAVEGMLGTNLWSIADGSAKGHDNIALSENILYGSPKVSVVNATARLEFDFESSRGALWTVDPDGGERTPVPRDKTAEIGPELSSAITKVRGSMMPIDGVGGVTIGDWEMFNQLRSLGYIEGPGPADATTPPSPPEAVPSP